jgi:single-strand DNA-binding protein
VNKVILMGNLGADPELKMTNGGTAVMSLRLATTRREKKGDDWHDVTEWHSVTVWAKRAEALSKILVKGSKILVEGELRTRSWEDQDGNKRYKTEVHAQEIELCDRRRDGEGGGRRDEAPASRASSSSERREQPAASYDGPGAIDDDDDIPF